MLNDESIVEEEIKSSDNNEVLINEKIRSANSKSITGAVIATAISDIFTIPLGPKTISYF